MPFDLIIKFWAAVSIAATIGYAVGRRMAPIEGNDLLPGEESAGPTPPNASIDARHTETGGEA